jgi:predicted metalloprotease with PDZ domain
VRGYLRYVVTVSTAIGFLVLGAGQGTAAAQTIRTHLNVLSTVPARVRIDCESRTPTRDFSFLQAYAGAQGLGQRIENFAGVDAAGTAVKITRLAPGEFVAEPPAIKWSYEVDLRPPDGPDDAAYVSWLTAERGLLLLKDLLPLPVKSGPKSAIGELELAITAPAGWRIATAEKGVTPGQYAVRDWPSSVFFISPDFRQTGRRTDPVNLSVIASGAWAFSDQDVADLARDVLHYHQKSVNDPHPLDALLIVAPFPTVQAAERWSAETRGRTVVLLSGRMPARLPALGTLSVSLTHELFHLWIPNRVNLEGDYAWFYEGFTLYQALRCGVALGYFTFGDVLGALARSYDAYRQAPNFDQLSLAQAGERRWTGGNALVYNKGLLAAFLLDADMRVRGGKRTLDTVFRELLAAHDSSKSSAPAGSTIVNLLQREWNLSELVLRLIVGAEAIDLRSMIAPYGLQLNEVGGKSLLSVQGKLSGRQKDFLKGLGYR